MISEQELDRQINKKLKWIGPFLLLWSLLAFNSTWQMLQDDRISYGGRGSSKTRYLVKFENPVGYYTMAWGPSVIGCFATVLGVAFIIANRISSGSGTSDAPRS